MYKSPSNGPTGVSRLDDASRGLAPEPRCPQSTENSCSNCGTGHICACRVSDVRGDTCMDLTQHGRVPNRSDYAVVEFKVPERHAIDNRNHRAGERARQGRNKLPSRHGRSCDHVPRRFFSELKANNKRRQHLVEQSSLISDRSRMRRQNGGGEFKRVDPIRYERY